MREVQKPSAQLTWHRSASPKRPGDSQRLPPSALDLNAGGEYGPRVFRMTVGLAAVLVVGAVLLPSSSAADSVKRYDQDGVPRSVVERFALTDDERRALDISSMRVTGAEGFGVLVEIRLHGDFQRRIGRRGLRRGALALSLYSAGGPASAVTVLTRGEAVRRQQVLRSPAQTAAVAVRTGRTVRVLVQTPGFAAIERVEVVSFARGPVAPTDRRGSVQADGMGLQLDPVETMPAFASCDELEHIYDGITRALGGADQLVFRLERLVAALQAELRRTRAMTERVALRRALSKLRATYRVARSQRGLLLSLGGDGELLLEECYQPRAGG